MSELHYYAQRKTIKNEQAQVNPVNKVGTKQDMLYQYFLFCASAVKNTDGNDLDYVEFGTFEQGCLRHEVFVNDTSEPEAETE